jgi:SulP family sulfate permease
MASRPTPPTLPAIPRPRIAAGLRDAWRAGYGLPELRKDVLAGLTIGIVAVPLAMALAIATGVPPQHGLYTAIIAGIVIALTGGSRFNVSGPTAAFVVILLPIVQAYGLGGLLVATIMAGCILVAMGVGRMGALIQFVPYPVVLGFTAGIGVVIATLQLPDFMGLALPAAETGSGYVEKLAAIVRALPGLEASEASMEGNPGGEFIYGAWSQLQISDGASDAMVRRIHYIDDYIPSDAWIFGQGQTDPQP